MTQLHRNGWTAGPWIDWTPGSCPVSDDTMVEIKAMMPGETEPRELFMRYAWASMWDNPRVVAYRIMTLDRVPA